MEVCRSKFWCIFNIFHVTLATFPRTKKPFTLFNFWINHPEFLPLVEEVWADRVVDFPMFQLVTKLKRLKMRLKAWNLEAFSGISDKVKEARAKLVDA